MKKLWLIITIFSLWRADLVAQTCCSGGVPVSSNLGLPSGESQTLQFNLSYDLNVLETLKSGTEFLDDQSRNRTTHSVLFEIGYSFTSRISLDGFFSYVRQERTITNFGRRDFTYTQGIGDAVFLAKYKLLSSVQDKTVLQVALGAKAPLGRADMQNRETGILLNADLQPGSGAWDGVGWAQFTHVTGFRPSLSVISILVYSLKGTNPNYLGVQAYQFGNEFQLSAGISDRVLIGNLIVDPALLLRYRTVKPDRNNDSQVPSTGGNWVFLNPSFSLWLGPDASVNINGDLPLFSNLAGTQVTPTYRINVGFYYRLSFRKTDSTNNLFNQSLN